MSPFGQRSAMRTATGAAWRRPRRKRSAGAIVPTPGVGIARPKRLKRNAGVLAPSAKRRHGPAGAGRLSVSGGSRPRLAGEKPGPRGERGNEGEQGGRTGGSEPDHVLRRENGADCAGGPAIRSDEEVADTGPHQKGGVEGHRRRPPDAADQDLAERGATGLESGEERGPGRVREGPGGAVERGARVGPHHRDTAAKPAGDEWCGDRVGGGPDRRVARDRDQSVGARREPPPECGGGRDPEFAHREEGEHAPARREAARPRLDEQQGWIGPGAPGRVPALERTAARPFAG